MSWIRATAHGLPLWARLVTITTFLIAFGLLLAGFLSAMELRHFLVAQVDAKLQAEGKAAASTTVSSLLSGSDSDYTPSDYCVRVQIGNQVVWRISSRVKEVYGVPDLPALSTAQASTSQGEPFTARSASSDVAWRAVAYPLTSGGTNVGTVVIALPLGDVQQTGRQMVVLLLASGLGIVLVGGLAGGWAVRRSLRPLRQIEATAASIAAGDLSQRVPQAPERTEVGRLGAALNGMLTQIESAFAARTASEARMRRFVADASHELRTPLATIRGYAELYRMGALADKAAMDDTMGRIEGSATRMGGLVEDLLALARLDEGRPLHLESLDLVVPAADAVADLQALDPTRTTRLVGLTGDQVLGPVRVHADEARVRQVIANLVGNVARHTPAGTPAELAVGTLTDATGSSVGVIEVRDHGPGISPEHAGRVFERFYRIDASRTRDSGGAGLGMAIVAAIVGAHHGAVDLLETPGGGATVRVTLPTGPGVPPPTPEAGLP
jgi:two-component system OmpR family sensor kinase